MTLPLLIKVIYIRRFFWLIPLRGQDLILIFIYELLNALVILVMEIQLLCSVKFLDLFVSCPLFQYCLWISLRIHYLVIISNLFSHIAETSLSRIQSISFVCCRSHFFTWLRTGNFILWWNIALPFKGVVALVTSAKFGSLLLFLTDSAFDKIHQTLLGLVRFSHQVIPTVLWSHHVNYVVCLVESQLVLRVWVVFGCLRISLIIIS